MANALVFLRSDNLGSGGDYDDSGYYEAHVTELFGTDIDTVFESQYVEGVYGKKRWAFIDPATGFKGHDLEARLFHDRDYDLYYLVHRPSQEPIDWINDGITGAGAGVPDKFQQAAQLMELVRPEFRDKIVLSGFSLGGGLAAYAALKAPWDARAVVFDPLGLNRTMLGVPGWGMLGQGEVLSDRFRHMDDHVDWFYIAKSWVTRANRIFHLSSIGKVTELPSDSVRTHSSRHGTHDFGHVRYGLHRLWEEKAPN
jgi:pimeloyl-ACP methyl ester carboxylesterase